MPSGGDAFWGIDRQVYPIWTGLVASVGPTCSLNPGRGLSVHQRILEVPQGVVGPHFTTVDQRIHQTPSVTPPLPLLQIPDELYPPSSLPSPPDPPPSVVPPSISSSGWTWYKGYRHYLVGTRSKMFRKWSPDLFDARCRQSYEPDSMLLTIQLYLKQSAIREVTHDILESGQQPCSLNSLRGVRGCNLRTT